MNISPSQVGRTENIVNCLDPKFTNSFKVDYYFEEVQKVQFSVYDLDNNTPKLSDDDFLGQVECTLGQVGVALRAHILYRTDQYFLSGAIEFECFMLLLFFSDADYIIV